jgi:hypothetical protein
MEGRIGEADVCATAAFVIVNRFSEMNSIHLEELEHRELWQNESSAINL